MSKHDPSISTLLGDLETPAPPPALRRMALQAAAEALDHEPSAGLLARIWESRGLRLAWVACVVVLLAGHLLVSLYPMAPVEVADTVTPAPLNTMVAVTDPELVDEIGELPRLQLSTTPLTGRGQS